MLGSAGPEPGIATASYYGVMCESFKLPTWPDGYNVFMCSHKLNFLLIENGKHTHAFQTYLILVYWFGRNFHLCVKTTFNFFQFGNFGYIF